MNLVLLGALAMSSAVAGLFFLRFWAATRDRLHLFFALSFFTLVADWLWLAFVEPGSANHHYVFLLRLAAFVLMIVGIVDKNRRGAGG